MKSLRVGSSALLAIFALGPALPSVTLPDDPERVLDQYVAAYNHGDAAILAGLYAEDAWLLPQGHAIIHGHRNIEAFWKRRLSLDGPRRRSGAPVFSKVIDKGAGPDIGYLVASMGAPVDEAYHFTLCLKRDLHGDWRIAAEMWNEGSARYRLVPAEK